MSFFAHSGRTGTLAAVASPSSNRLSKSKPMSPLSSARLSLTAASTAPSWISISARRVSPSESKAPALMSDSIARLFATGVGTFLRKSWKPVKRPFSSLACRMPETTLWPTLRTAPRPKRMSSPTAVKNPIDSFTSGGSTVMPMRRHSLRYTAILSFESPTLVSRAAMYSAG